MADKSDEIKEAFAVTDVPKAGDRLDDWTVCSANTCSTGGTPTDPANPLNRLVTCTATNNCAAPCKCRLFSWKSGFRWWDSDNDLKDHGETGAGGLSIPKNDFLVREFLCACVKPFDPDA